MLAATAIGSIVFYLLFKKHYQLSNLNLPKPLDIIPRILNGNNIEAAISDYKNLLKDVNLKIEGKTLLELMIKLKRKEMQTGPYPHVSIFEAANRIMTDLVILFGVRQILANKFENLKDISEIKVDLGNENSQAHDIICRVDNKEFLSGEAFNVAPSFFNSKKSSSIRKLLQPENLAEHLLILCNDESHERETDGPYFIDSIQIIPVKIDIG